MLTKSGSNSDIATGGSRIRTNSSKLQVVTELIDLDTMDESFGTSSAISPESLGQTSSRKSSKSSRSNSKSHKKRSDSKSTKPRSSKGHHGKRKHEPASLRLAVIVILTTMKLLFQLVFSVVRGSAARSSAMLDLQRWILSGLSLVRSDPKHVVIMTLYFAFIGGGCVFGLWIMGYDVNVTTLAQGSSLRGAETSLGAADLAQASAGGGDVDSEEADAEEVPDQGSTEKKKISRKEELAFACKEVDCVEKCVTKSTKKCLQSESCIKTRVSSCKKKCRKARCENRCKIEPGMGYVEREMKTDKCKEDCQMNNKCIEKCDREGKTCKSRCAERKKKFVCDRQPQIPWPSAQAAAAAASVSDDDEGDDGTDDGSVVDASDGEDPVDEGSESSGAGFAEDDDDDEI